MRSRAPSSAMGAAWIPCCGPRAWPPTQPRPKARSFPGVTWIGTFRRQAAAEDSAAAQRGGCMCHAALPARVYGMLRALQELAREPGHGRDAQARVLAQGAAAGVEVLAPSVVGGHESAPHEAFLGVRQQLLQGSNGLWVRASLSLDQPQICSRSCGPSVHSRHSLSREMSRLGSWCPAQRIATLRSPLDACLPGFPPQP